jgi:hypothetical protein
MSRACASFKQTNVLRAWAAARRDGKEVVETRIGADGSIVLVHKTEPAPNIATAPCDAWKAANGSR